MYRDQLNHEASIAITNYESLTTLAYSRSAGEPSHQRRATQPLPINVDALDCRKDLETLLASTATRYPEATLTMLAGARPANVITDSIAAELHEWNNRAQTIVEPPRNVPIPQPCECGATQRFNLQNTTFTCDNGCSQPAGENPWVNAYQPTLPLSSSSAHNAGSSNSSETATYTTTEPAA